MTGKTTGVPDDLLTGPPDKSVLQAAIEAYKPDYSTPERRAEMKKLLAQLRDSEAWSYFKASCAEVKEQLETFIRDVSNPNELLKYSGELKMLNKMVTWPEAQHRVIDTLDAQAKLAAQKKEQENERRNQEGPARGQRPPDRR